MTHEPENIDLKEWSHRQKDFHDTMSITRTRIFLSEEEEKKKKRKRKILIWRVIAILAICSLIFLDVEIASYQTTYKYQDVLQELKGDDPLYQNVNNYVRYLASRAAQHGQSGLDGKWLDDIPKNFDNAGTAKLKKLGKENFLIESIAADKEDVFHIKCHPLESLSETVELDVIKVKVKNDFIFRLLRVY